MEEDGQDVTAMTGSANQPEWWLRSTEAWIARCAEDAMEVALRRVPETDATGGRRRTHESDTARTLACDLLRRHGVAVAEIGRHAEGFPLWPEGWVGSLSHSAGWCAAGLARETVVRGVGVDVENPARMKPEMWAHIMTENERRELERRSPGGDANERGIAATAVFSAKEALFKALFPLRRAVPGFLATEIAWLGEGKFRAQVNADTVDGRCAMGDGMVLAAAWVTAREGR